MCSRRSAVPGLTSLSLNQIYDSPATPNLPLSDFALPQPVPRVVLKHSSNVTAVQGRGAGRPIQLA